MFMFPQIHTHYSPKPNVVVVGVSKEKLGLNELIRVRPSSNRITALRRRNT